MRPLPSLLSLWITLVRQDVAVRYRGTLLGRGWPLLLPLLMLGVYGFVFGAVLRMRWPGQSQDDLQGFALMLFTGLLVHGVLAEILGQTPGLMSRHANFVRKMVFPLPVLVAVPLGSALWHALVGLALTWLVHGTLTGQWPLAVLAVPLILLPYCTLLMGLGLVLSALGVYLRDLGQIGPALATFALFTGAVFYPAAMVPEGLGWALAANPITWPVEATRDALLLGQWPDLAPLALYSSVALLVLLAGARLFSVLRRGFADVL